MSSSDTPNQGRRSFFKYAAALSVGAKTLLSSADLRAAVFDAKETVALPWPEMTYRTLGRTGHESSRLIFGCGAALMRTPKDRLLNTALEAGVNTFDVGYGRYYRMAERNMAEFLKQHRDDVFLISKAPAPVSVDPDESVSVESAKAAAERWLGFMEESLRDLQVEQVDAYYQMASFNPHVIASEEMYQAFEKAKAAGKVRFLGLSTHQNAQRVLEAAIESGFYDLAMIAITPGGWYDWESKSVLSGSPPMADLQSVLARAREAGIGLIGMKAVRHLAKGFLGGRGNTRAFDEYYSPEFKAARLTGFQKSYAYVLAHGLDCVNSDIQSFDQLKENHVAAATSDEYFTSASTA